jgi:hypothetical protein
MAVTSFDYNCSGAIESNLRVVASCAGIPLSQCPGAVATARRWDLGVAPSCGAMAQYQSCSDTSLRGGIPFTECTAITGGIELNLCR